MPRAIINYIVSFSSEDPEHPASNLLAKEVSKKKWLCSKGETSCSVVLQLVRSVQVSAVHVGAHHAALVEVLVGRSENSNEPFKVLVPSSIFVNPSDSRRGEGVERVRSFSADQLSADTRSQKWDQVRVVCSQPYNKHCKYGLSFIHIFEPEGKDIPTASVPPPTVLTRFLSFDTRSSDEEDTFKLGELFAEYKQNKAGLDGNTQTSKVSTETQIRKATSQALQHNSDTSSQLVKTPIGKDKIKDKSSSSKERDSNRETERNRDRSTLLYDEDDEKPHSKIDQVVQRHKNEKIKRESDSKSHEKHRHRSKSKESDHRQSKESKSSKDKKEKSKPRDRHDSSTSKDRKDNSRHRSKENDECSSKEEEKRKKVEDNKDSCRDRSKASSVDRSKEKDERSSKDEEKRKKVGHNKDSCRDRSKASSGDRSKEKDERSSKDEEKRKKVEHNKDSCRDTSKESSRHRSKEKDERRSKDEEKRKKVEHKRSKDGSHNSSRESKRPHSNDRSLENESKRLKSGPLSSSPHNLMSGVVFTLSGYENPRRAQVRDKALAMGAKFQREWDNRCTHLICAFPNTPKLRTVRSQSNGASIVVTTAEWIEECCDSRRLLPWQWFATEPKFKVTRPEDDGRDEEMETTNVVESECDTDDEIEKVLQRQKRDSRANTNQRPSSSKDKTTNTENVTEKDNGQQEKGFSNGVDSYDYATDEEEKRNRQIEVDENATLPDFFEGLTFAIEDTVSEVGFDKQQLKRYAWAYGGEVLELFQIDESSEVDYVVTRSQSSIQGASVRPDWIWRCHEKQRLCSADAYLIT